MGGMGSGNRWRYGEKNLTTDYRSIDVQRWARDGFLASSSSFNWRWSINGEQTGLINVRTQPSRVVLD